MSDQDRIAKLEAALRKIQQWDCLNPPVDWISDSKWLKQLVDEALDE